MNIADVKHPFVLKVKEERIGGCHPITALRSVQSRLYNNPERHHSIMWIIGEERINIVKKKTCVEV